MCPVRRILLLPNRLLLLLLLATVTAPGVCDERTTSNQRQHPQSLTISHHITHPLP